MPAHRDSLRITDAYRQRLIALRDHAAHVARGAWRQIHPEDLDATHAAWVATTATTTEAIQHAGLQLTAGYLAAFLTSELRRRTAAAGDQPHALRRPRPRRPSARRHARRHARHRQGRARRRHTGQRGARRQRRTCDAAGRLGDDRRAARRAQRRDPRRLAHPRLATRHRRRLRRLPGRRQRDPRRRRAAPRPRRLPLHRRAHRRRRPRPLPAPDRSASCSTG
jgi:hypothetical protein